MSKDRLVEKNVPTNFDISIVAAQQGADQGNLIPRLPAKDSKDSLAYPEAIDKKLDYIFNKLNRSAQLLTEKEFSQLLKESADEVLNNGNLVFNEGGEGEVGLKGRVPPTITAKRDVQITNNELEMAKLGVEDALKNGLEVYKVWTKAGESDGGKGGLELTTVNYVTQAGLQLMFAGGVMGEISFSEPDSPISGRYTAIPEISKDERIKPLALFYIDKNNRSSTVIFQTGYPGEKYKFDARAGNNIAYEIGGMEVHAAATLVNLKIVSKEKDLNVDLNILAEISGLSLTGKTTLSTEDIGNALKKLFAEKYAVSEDEVQIGLELYHDDYISYIPDEKGGYWLVRWAPNGIFPALSDNLESDNPLTGQRNVGLWTVVTQNGKADFSKKFKFIHRVSGEEQTTGNRRAVAPLIGGKDGTFGIDVRERIIHSSEIDEKIHICLTRNMANPTAMVVSPEDYILNFAAVPVDRNQDAADAVPGETGGLSPLNSDFTVRPIQELMERYLEINTSLSNREENPMKMTYLILNTGPEVSVETTLGLLPHLYAETYNTDFDPKTSVKFISSAAGVENIYNPWEKYPEENWAKAREILKQIKRAWLAEKWGVDFENPVIAKIAKDSIF